MTKPILTISLSTTTNGIISPRSAMVELPTSKSLSTANKKPLLSGDKMVAQAPIPLTLPILVVIKSLIPTIYLASLTKFVFTTTPVPLPKSPGITIEANPLLTINSTKLMIALLTIHQVTIFTVRWVVAIPLLLGLLAN